MCSRKNKILTALEYWRERNAVGKRNEMESKFMNYVVSIPAETRKSYHGKKKFIVRIDFPFNKLWKDPRGLSIITERETRASPNEESDLEDVVVALVCWSLEKLKEMILMLIKSAPVDSNSLWWALLCLILPKYQLRLKHTWNFHCWRRLVHSNRKQLSIWTRKWKNMRVIVYNIHKTWIIGEGQCWIKIMDVFMGSISFSV